MRQDLKRLREQLRVAFVELLDFAQQHDAELKAMTVNQDNEPGSIWKVAGTTLIYSHTRSYPNMLKALDRIIDKCPKPKKGRPKK